MTRWWNALLGLCILLAFSATTSISHAYANDEPPSGLTAQGAVLMDMQSGQVLFNQNMDAKLYPASITKIMTCLLALEKSDLDEMVTTSQLAREQEGNRVYLETGEQEPMEQMLYGLMLNSGNDAAVAIAEHIGGSVEGFAKMMNDKARELGAVNTHFVTPNGLHDDNHYTTPYDMALISKYAMQNEKFREIVGTEYYKWDGQEWHTTLVNINPMLWNYDGATGVKTGFTDQAQQTMVVTAKQGDRELLAVLMGVQNRQTIRLEATALLDYGFHSTRLQRLAKHGDVLFHQEIAGIKVGGMLEEDLYYASPVSEDQHLTEKVSFRTASVVPPFAKGTKIGWVTFSNREGDIVASADLYADHGVFPPVEVDSGPSWIVTTLKIIGWVLLVLVVIVLLLRRRKRNRARRKAPTYPKYF
ncbi:MAG TPA: D-alanyl-D-alanine carboxypeptidase family protein [Bacilli bacterium]|nr:D-alanyl-D-alanine carboxypeptidase family protein [Bacilli bacterium]